jgi:hypothetical protein
VVGGIVRDGVRIKYKLMGFMVYFYLRKINTCYCMTYLIHERNGKRMLTGKFTYIHHNATTVTLDVGFPATFALRLVIRLKFLFTKCTQFEQCTYLGFVLLEGPQPKTSFMVPF